MSCARRHLNQPRLGTHTTPHYAAAGTFNGRLPCAVALNATRSSFGPWPLYCRFPTFGEIRWRPLRNAARLPTECGSCSPPHKPIGTKHESAQGQSFRIVPGFVPVQASVFSLCAVYAFQSLTINFFEITTFPYGEVAEWLKAAVC
jgi:hypothetical protein